MVAVALIAGTLAATRAQLNDHALTGVCRNRVDRAFAACKGDPTSTEGRVQCAEALMDLELLEDNATVWRVQWIASAAAALVVAAVGPLLNCSALGLFVVAFVTVFATKRAMCAFETAHVKQAPRTSRMRLIRGMHGSSPDTLQYYYTS